MRERPRVIPYDWFSFDEWKYYVDCNYTYYLMLPDLTDEEYEEQIAVFRQARLAVHEYKMAQRKPLSSDTQRQMMRSQNEATSDHNFVESSRPSIDSFMR